MKIRFWGTRGSLPVALTAPQVLQKIAKALVAASGQRFETTEQALSFARELPFDVGQTFGGHSSCVELEAAPPTGPHHDYVLCDLGSGLRTFGSSVLARHGARGTNTFHIFISHVHWDHIMGFPLFAPAYMAGNRICLYGSMPNLKPPCADSMARRRFRWISLNSAQRWSLSPSPPAKPGRSPGTP